MSGLNTKAAAEAEAEEEEEEPPPPEEGAGGGGAGAALTPLGVCPLSKKLPTAWSLSQLAAVRNFTACSSAR